MASPQEEREYLDLLRQREESLRRIKKIQEEIDAAGFMPADQKKHNDLLAERVRILSRQKQVEAEIGRTSADVKGTVGRKQQYMQSVDDHLERIGKHREQARAAFDSARAAREARRLDLWQRHGTAGVLYGRAEQFGQSRVGRMMGGGAIAAGMFAGNAARSGFSGTVEQNQLDFEWQQLNREFASAFKPLIELFTKGVQSVRKFMEGLDGTGQNLVMIGGLLAGAYGLRAMGGRMVGGLTGMALGGPLGGMAGMMLGGMGGGAGAGGGGGMMGGGGGGAMNMAALATTPAMAAAGMTGMGSATAGTAARSGIRGAMMRAAKFPLKHPVATAAVVAGGLMLGGAMGGDDASESERFRKYHGDNAVALDNLEQSGGADAMLERYKQLRDGRGSGNKIASWFGARIGYAGQERDTIEELERRMRARGMNPETGKKRRDVTPAAAAYEEIGSAYNRASVSFLNKYAPTESDEAEGWGQVGKWGAMAGDAALGVGGGKNADVASGIQAMIGILEEIKKQGEPKAEVK